jgi:hypothetical protein
MTRSEFDNFIDQATSRGFTHVQTFGGPLPLSDWRPYGVFNGSNMEQYITGFEWLAEDKAADIPASPRLGNCIACGIWAFERLA